MNQLTNPASTALVSDEEFTQQLLGGLAESRQVVLNTGGGKPLLRLLKDGEWVFGQGDDPVQEGSHWAINVRTIGWGSVCWTNYPQGQSNKLLGKVIGPITQPKPATPAPIEGFPFTDFVTFDLLCLDGDDEGVEVSYGTSSIGGMRAFTKLRDAIMAQIQRDPRTPCPVVTLTNESYKGKYGKTYNPILNITGWATLAGVPAGEAVAEAPKEVVAAPAEPARKRKAPLGVTGAELAQAELNAKPGVQGSAPPIDPEPLPSTQQAHTGQRRRHRPTA
jgi:hypothetical protein